MTNEPRVARIRRPAKEAEETDTPMASPADAAEAAMAAKPKPEKAPADEPRPSAKPGESQKITGRDLRRARRKAKRLGLQFEDDHEALKLLKDKGINIQADDSILEFVPPTEQPQDTGGALTIPEPDALPDAPDTAPIPAPAVGAPVFNDAERLKEIERIQTQLVRRRRRRLAYLALKLAFFVALPTFLVGWYYHTVATDMYETQSAFTIQQAESPAAGMGGLLAGTGFAVATDSIAVQDFLTSRESLNRLDAEEDYISHFQNPEIDSVQRLPMDASNEEAYRLYQKNVKVGFDTTEGIIRMEVIAADPAAAERFANALIRYAEERVDKQTQRIRDDQMSGAMAAYEDAQANLRAAQDKVLELQQERGVLSAELEISAQMSLINALELEREQKRLDLAQVLANARPNDARVSVMEADLGRIDARIAELRAAMTESNDQSTSLALITGELAVAEADLATRQLMLQTSLQQVETARIEANRQVLYLATAVSPVAPDVATYPRALENTILAFVIFIGLYIMISLTVSILREQVSV